MEQVIKREIPLDIGTLDLQITFKFVPNGTGGNIVEHRATPITVTHSLTSSSPATDNQKRALAGMSRRLGRQIDLERLSKTEASNMIDEFGAELRRR